MNATETITGPGVYDVPMAEYHGREICPSPSISSSGLRAIVRCPAKYWYHSPLNPNRPPDESTPAFNFGRAAHDLILDGVGWPERYHVLPDGYDGRLKKWEEARLEKEHAEGNGLAVLRYDDYVNVTAMAEAIQRHPIHKALGRGKAEQTVVWQDKETGVWLRCRPDFLPDGQRFIPDFKTTASAYPDDFTRDIAAYGYHQQAVLYLDGLAAVLGAADRDFYFIAQEKSPPYVVQPFALDAETVAWGRRLNRRAIQTFARCLETGVWPGYADDFVSVGLPRWQVQLLESSFTGVPS